MLKVGAAGSGNVSDTDRTYMAQALQLAHRGLGKTAPNPAVGCVIVKGGQVCPSRAFASQVSSSLLQKSPRDAPLR